MSKSQRSLVAQLRLGILPLAIETGRYTNTPINERLCFWCKNKVENEFHFVYECILYENLRIELFSYMFQKIPGFLILSEEEKFLCIMKSDDRLLHIFVEKAWNIRKTKIYM